jgi:hypothetical protein
VSVAEITLLNNNISLNENFIPNKNKKFIIEVIITIIKKFKNVPKIPKKIE